MKSGVYTKFFTLSLFLVIFDLILLLLFEDKPFNELLFEVVSAFGTVGLSTSITSELNSISKIIKIMTMFIGRVGPLAFGSIILTKSEPVHYKYSEGEFYLG